MAKRRTPLRKSKYFFLASLIVISAVAVLLIWPFITAILGGAVLTYIFYPKNDFPPIYLHFLGAKRAVLRVFMYSDIGHISHAHTTSYTHPFDLL